MKRQSLACEMKISVSLNFIRFAHHYLILSIRFQARSKNRNKKEKVASTNSVTHSLIQHNLLCIEFTDARFRAWGFVEEDGFTGRWLPLIIQNILEISNTIAATTMCSMVIRIRASTCRNSVWLTIALASICQFHGHWFVDSMVIGDKIWSEKNRAQKHNYHNKQEHNPWMWSTFPRHFTSIHQ